MFLPKALVELAEIALVFRDLANKNERLLDEVLVNDLENLVLLQSFSPDVGRKVFRVDNTLDEVETLGNEIFTGVENPADVKLDVITLLLQLKEVRSTLGDEEKGLEFELTLNGEVLDSEMIKRW